jgi:hypothetical protein
MRENMSRSRTATLGALCTAASLAASICSLQADETDTPTVTVLQCEASCGKWTDPKLIEHPSSFPAGEARQQPAFNAEALVTIRFTVTADGHVKDPVVERLVGPEDFAEHSLISMKDWSFQPATLNGVPVARPNWKINLMYMFYPPDLGARDRVYVALRKARTLMEDQKFADSEAVLLPVLELDRLNFYERAMTSYFLALNELALKNYATAREYIEDATISRGTYLSKGSQEFAIRMQIRLDAATGQYGDALTWFPILSQITTVTADDRDAKLIADIRAQLASSGPIGVSGRIPKAGSSQPWRHDLLRRNFEFAKLDGKVDRFELRCDQQQIESAFSEKAEWHVPKTWSNCVLEVFGEPGATFQVAETND